MNKRHYEHTLPNIRGSLSNTYKASWCNVSPMSGKRDGVLTISAGAHTGRVARNTVVTVTAANGTRPSASIAVSQAGAGVSTTMDTSKPDLPSSGGVVNINGTSNSSKLKWTCTARVMGVDMPIDDNYVKSGGKRWEYRK